MNVVTELSRNRKTGPVSATYAPRQTCPRDCPLVDGCYAENYPCAHHFNRISREAKGKSMITIARDEAQGIRSLSGSLALRLHVSGDCATTQCAREIASACYDYRRKYGSPVWGYTHNWRKIPREAWGTISISASCEQITDIKKAFGRGYPAVLVVPELPSRCMDLQGGLTGIPCQQQSKGTPCTACRLCFDSTKLRQKGQVILFEPHGNGAKHIHNALA